MNHENKINCGEKNWKKKRIMKRKRSDFIKICDNSVWWGVVLCLVVQVCGIVVTPNQLCDGMACKCGYESVICECVNQIQVRLKRKKKIKQILNFLFLILVFLIRNMGKCIRQSR